MEDGDAVDHQRLAAEYETHASEHLVEHLLDAVRRMEGPTLGYQVDRARHSRQSATRALRNGESTELVVAALLHDIGDDLSPHNHSAVAAAVLEPFVSEETTWVIGHHGLFQGYYFFHHLGGDRDARERVAGSPHYERCVDFCANYDQNCFDPEYDDLDLEEFRPMIAEIVSRPRRFGTEGAA